MSKSNEWERKYVKGTARQKTFPDGQYIINVSLSLSDISDAPEFCVRTDKNGNKYLQLNVAQVKGGEDKFGNTHNVFFAFPKGEGGSGDSKDEPKAGKDKEWDF